MYPFMRDGDILTIQPVEVAPLKVGDIAFYRTSEKRLAAHRVVDKKHQGDKVMLLMRGDSVFKNDGWIYSDKVLGKVVGIQRDKKFIQFDQGVFLRLIMCLWNKLYPIGPFFFNGTLKGKRGLSWVLRRVQSLKIYRFVARKLINGKISYRIATERDASGVSRFYGYKRLPEIEDPAVLPENQIQNQSDYGYTFIACKRGTILGAAEITRFPDDEVSYPDWWLFGMRVRIPYRGIGIGKELVRRATEKASGEGASRLNLMVYEKNKAAMNLFHKMGFRQISIQALDEQLEEEAKQTNQQRIILSKELYPKNAITVRHICGKTFPNRNLLVL